MNRRGLNSQTQPEGSDAEPQLSPPSMQKRMAPLVKALQKKSQEEDRRADETEYLRSRLNDSSWYPVSIPLFADEVGNFFQITADAAALIDALSKRNLEGKHTAILIASPPTNIFARLAAEDKTLPKPYSYVPPPHRKGLQKTAELALQNAEDLAQKCRVLYEALQSQENNDSEANRVPILFMNRFAELPHFSHGYWPEIIKLFDENSEFANAAYACVPEKFRPQGAAQKNYTELLKAVKENKGDAKKNLHHAQDAVAYVLYQVAIVLCIGGTKLGHVAEFPYDQVTVLARDLLKTGRSRLRESNFKAETLPLPQATGTIPYRAIAQQSPQRSLVKSAGSRRNLPSPEDLIRSIREVIASDPAIVLDHEKATLEEAYENHYLAAWIHELKGEDPLWEFLLTRMKVLEALEGKVSITELRAHIAEWLPFKTRQKNHAGAQFHYLAALLRDLDPQRFGKAKLPYSSRFDGQLVVMVPSIWKTVGYEFEPHAGRWEVEPAVWQAQVFTSTEPNARRAQGQAFTNFADILDADPAAKILYQQWLAQLKQKSPAPLPFDSYAYEDREGFYGPCLPHEHEAKLRAFRREQEERAQALTTPRDTLLAQMAEDTRRQLSVCFAKGTFTPSFAAHFTTQ